MGKSIGTGSQIKFKTLMPSSILFDYSDVYILFKGAITVPNTAGADLNSNNRNRKVKLCSIY